MASSTTTYTDSSEGQHYTIGQLNGFFSDVAAVINGKLDSEDEAQALTAAIAINLQTIINLAEGTDDTDAVTVGQVDAAFGGADASAMPTLQEPANDTETPVGEDEGLGQALEPVLGAVGPDFITIPDGFLPRSSDVTKVADGVFSGFVDLLDDFLDKNGGSQSLQKSLDMNGNKITSLPQPTEESDLVPLNFLMYATGQGPQP